MGGGVAGLSAAHELLKRGFRVTIVEKSSKYLGGKARSIEYEPKNTGLKLPAEHGFRFFPGFYGNITETMKEIKTTDGKSVYDNLVPVKYYTFLFTDGRDPIKIPLNIGFDFIRNGDRIRKEIKILRQVFDDEIIHITEEGRNYFLDKIIQLYTSCEERFLTEYERIPWEEFIEARNPNFGRDYRSVLAEGVTKNLVACRADKSSTRTGGKILAHILWQIISPFSDKADRILNAPTNEAWIYPWLKYLKTTYPCKLKVITGKRVIELNVKEKSYNGFRKDAIIDVKTADADSQVGRDSEGFKADFFISTLPIERLHSLLQRSSEIFIIDPTLGLLEKLSKEVEWMNGIIFYLNRDLKIANGHVTIMDSDMAITIVSQTQYWQEYLASNPLPAHNGKLIKSVLSVIVSNWDAKSQIFDNTLTLKQLCRDQVKKEIWEQIKKCRLLDDNGRITYLTDADYFSDLTFLDEAIVPRRQNAGSPGAIFNNPNPDDTGNKLFNKEPLLVNTVVGHALRPDAHTRVENLFIASDFVKTNSDLADMDTANEAARRAVNNILKKLERPSSEFCKTDPYTLPSPLGLFGLARLRDERNFRKGLPWQKPAGLYFVLKHVMRLGLKIAGLPKVLFYPVVIVVGFLIPLAILVNYLVVVGWKFINSFYAFR